MALRTPFANDAKTYGFEWFRGMLEASLQQGVLNMGGAGTDCKATVQTGTMKMDVAAGAALMKGTSGTSALGITQGLHMVINDAAVTGAVTLDAADATFPRLDQICFKIEDSSDLGSAADQVTVVVVKGTPASGCTLDNRSGAPALPANHFRLRDQLVPAGATQLLEANGRDRRSRARGAHGLTTDNSLRSTTSGTASEITSNYRQRHECDGVNPWLCRLAFRFEHTQANVAIDHAILVDGAGVAGQPNRRIRYATAGQDTDVVVEWLVTPAAGSHYFSVSYWLPTVSGTGYHRNDQALGVFAVEEKRALYTNGG